MLEKMHQTINQNHIHIPVLSNAVLQYLRPVGGESYLDATAGYGGHARQVQGRTFQEDPGKFTLIDRDKDAIDTLTSEFGNSAQIIHKDFLSGSKQLLRQGKQYDMILADIGVSSPHINQASRGFSINGDGPLDMRMDIRQQLTAFEIVNNYSEAEIARILREYGEEPKAKKIAKLVVQHRPIKTTHELATVVCKAWPGHSKSHPATRSFQALRIAVNDELGQIRQALDIWGQLLAPGGRLAVISFHSLEDRIVKQYFAEHTAAEYESDMVLLTKKPVVADNTELVHNPRARSAKLRAVLKK